MSFPADAALSGFAFEPLAAPPPLPPRPASPAAAQAEVDLLVQGAHVEADEIRTRARDEGYAEGHSTGLLAARQELLGAAEALAAATAQVVAAREAALAEAEREGVALALSLAEKILSGAVDVAPERVLDVVSGALRRLEDRGRVTIVVAPEDLDLVRGGLDDVAASLGGFDRLDVQADRRVSRGGAIVRTGDGEVDARLPEQLERAREVVEAELRR